MFIKSNLKHQTNQCIFIDLIAVHNFCIESRKKYRGREFSLQDQCQCLYRYIHRAQKPSLCNARLDHIAESVSDHSQERPWPFFRMQSLTQSCSLTATELPQGLVWRWMPFLVSLCSLSFAGFGATFRWVQASALTIFGYALRTGSDHFCTISIIKKGSLFEDCRFVSRHIP